MKLLHIQYNTFDFRQKETLVLIYDMYAFGNIIAENK
jgi:hypothetical protein